MPDADSRGESVALPAGTVTFLFADLEGSTRLVADLGDAYVATLEAYRGLVREAIAAHGGHELGTEGDSFFVAFESAPKAIRCAVDAQLAARLYAWPAGSRVAARMGIHTGEASPHENGYVGLAVHQAARVAAAANGGQILASDTTRALAAGALGSDVDMVDLGSHRLKDLDLPLRLFEVRHEEIEPGPPPRSLDARPHNLPVQATRFTGRDAELTEARKLIEDDNVRLVTLTGPGGIGKTRLAVQTAAAAAGAFPDGVWFVPLTPVLTADAVPSAVAQAIGARETEDRTASSAVLADAAGRRMLLLLDNVEHLVSCAPFVAQLLATAPDVTVLATSREPLHIAAERVFPVPPMEVPAADATSVEALAHTDAIALFVERAQGRDPSFALDSANAEAVAEICRRLDGLPLAIELAAARVSSLGVSGLAERLREGLAVLAGGPDDAPERHRTLDAAIAWSYDMLDDGERRIVRALSVFSGSFDAAAAGAVAGADVDDLTRLVERSLITSDASSGLPRFSMLETIRAFAAKKLDEAQETDALVVRHTEYFSKLAQDAEPHLHRAAAVEWLDRLTMAHDDLRAAMERCWESGDSETAASMTASLAEFWRMRGHLEEGRQRLERAIEASPSGSSARARAIVGLARIRRSGSMSVAPKHLAPLLLEATETAERHDDTSTLARALAALAPIERSRTASVSFATGLVAGATDVGMPESEAATSETAPVPKPRRGIRGRKSRVKSRDMLERALRLAEEIGDEFLAAEIRTSPFRQRGARNFFRAALGDPRILRESVEDAVSRGDRAAEAELLLRRQTGDLREREAAALRAMQLATDLGDRELMARAKLRVAEMAMRRKDPIVAVPVLHEALQLAREIRAETIEQEVLAQLVAIAHQKGDRDGARALYARLRVVDGRLQATLSRMSSVTLLSQRFPGWLTIAAGLVWAIAFYLPVTTLRAWLIAGSGYALTQAADAVAYGPAYRRKVAFNDPIPVFIVGVSFGVGLWVRSEPAASLLAFGLLGCLAPAGILRGRVFGRGSKAVNAIAMVAGVVTTEAVPPAAPAIAMILVAWVGFRSVRDHPPADVGWALARSAAAVARFAAAVAAMDVLARWRTAGQFRFEAWGDVAAPVAFGALAVFGLAVAASDRQLRFGGITLALTSIALPNAFVAPAPASQVIGAAFGLAWILIGALRWFEKRPDLPEIYPARLRAADATGAPPRALA